MNELRTSERLGMPTIVVPIICVLATAVSVKSIVVLGRASPWTSVGWWLTIVYLGAVIARDTFGFNLPAYLEYSVLAGLSIAFVVAGIRDERQAEPWWWPNRCGSSREEKRRVT